MTRMVQISVFICREWLLTITEIWDVKIETLSILWNCSRSSQAIGDIYDFEFSLGNKIFESRETIKSQIVWDFPNIWKPGLNLPFAIGNLQIFLTDMTPRLYSFLHWNFKCSSFTPEKNLGKIYTTQRVNNSTFDFLQCSLFSAIK